MSTSIWLTEVWLARKLAAPQHGGVEMQNDVLLLLLLVQLLLLPSATSATVTAGELGCSCAAPSS
jgi:hypothetical protein